MQFWKIGGRNVTAAEARKLRDKKLKGEDEGEENSEEEVDDQEGEQDNGSPETVTPVDDTVNIVHKLSKEDLKENPQFKELGFKKGDVVKYPEPEEGEEIDFSKVEEVPEPQEDK